MSERGSERAVDGVQHVTRASPAIYARCHTSANQALCSLAYSALRCLRRGTAWCDAVRFARNDVPYWYRALPYGIWWGHSPPGG